MKLLGRSLKKEVKAKATITRGEGGKYWFVVNGLAVSITPGFERQREAEEVLQTLVDITSIEVEHVDKYEARTSVGG